MADRWGVVSSGTALTVDWGGNAQVLVAFGAAGNSTFGIRQSIEANNSYDMAGKTVTMAVTVDSASYSGTIAINMYRMTTRDSTSGMVIVGGAAFTGPYSARRLSAQFNVPPSGNLGLYIEILTSGITSGVLTFKEAQLEVGLVATPFERKPYGTELEMCQRYYQQLPTNFTISGSTSGVGATLRLPVSMRASPTVTHKYLDASYVLSGTPAAGQWSMQILGVAAASKTGTIIVEASAVDNTSAVINFYGMTLSTPVNYLVSGDASFAPKLSAEI